MTLRTGKQCKWEDIEIGEVFAYDGCIEIFCKIKRYHAICLASDECGNDNIDIDSYDQTGSEWFMDYNDNRWLYKLPKEIQSLWKEE